MKQSSWFKKASQQEAVAWELQVAVQCFMKGEDRKPVKDIGQTHAHDRNW